MQQIKFTHDYPKLWGQKEAHLIKVSLLDAQDVAKNKDLIEYDTKYYKKEPSVDEVPFDYYPLPKHGELIQLVFIGEKDIPFCTLRRYTPEKWNYYLSLKGEVFEVVITDDKKI